MTQSNVNGQRPKVSYVFFGTPELAVKLLETLKTAGLAPILVVTNPDEPRGRKMLPTSPPVKIWAEKNNLPCLQPEKLDDKFVELIKESGADFALVAAYGKILPQTLLDSLPLGFFNVHYSLLPKYRGATPVESAILNGDSETGVSIQKMVFKLDAGDIIANQKVPIEQDETSPELRTRLNQVAAQILVKILPQIAESKITSVKQDENLASSCSKIEKSYGQIDLSDPALTNYRKYRAYFAWPGTFFFTKHNGRDIRVVVKKAELQNGAFVILKVIPEGKKEMSFQDFRKGLRPA